METNEARLNSELCGTPLHLQVASLLPQAVLIFTPHTPPCLALSLLACLLVCPSDPPFPLSLSLSRSVSLASSYLVHPTPPSFFRQCHPSLRSIALLGPCQICQEQLSLESLFSDAAAVLHPLLIGFSLALFSVLQLGGDTAVCTHQLEPIPHILSNIKSFYKSACPSYS